MPYWLHPIGADPTTGAEYQDKQEALSARADGQTVTRVVSADECHEWHERECVRFDNETYARVPWYIKLYSNATCYHFAHISLKTPGLIAYTPSDIFGVEDRQLRVKPGKYLQEFFGDRLSAEDITNYASHVKAWTDTLKLARTPEEIVRVYCASDGPTSCMDGHHHRRDHHPTRVYGDSDLAVAYTGSLDTDGNTDHDTIAARAVVWPDKHIYSRIYGDTDTLRHILKAGGYTSGSLNGARVRAIPTRGDYVMPYIDGIEECRVCHTDDGWITLGGGDLSCQNTSGHTSQVEQYYCANCECTVDENTTYCNSCTEDRVCCRCCDTDYFNESDGEDLNGNWYCDACVSRHSHTCEACQEPFNRFEFSPRTWNARNQDLCDACEDNYTRCDNCDTYTPDSDLTGGLCDACTPKPPVCPPRPRGTVLRHHTIDTAPVCSEVTL